IISFTKSLDVEKRLKTRTSAAEVDLRELPPTAKFIYKLLLYEGEMTQKEIAEVSSIPTRTIRNALNILLEKGLITKKVNVRDTRQFVYHVAK
ncbi:MAG: MarR family transcriptional regulator, partial [Candidatus Odinarchaeota archaeon]|nr:MarR family transcriptional regulator [Candidatus Odinarchaeota archaeon]